MRRKTKKDVLTTGQIARLCNVAPRTVAKWFDKGELHGYRIPGSRDRRVPLQQLVRFMQAHGIPLNRLDTGIVRIGVIDHDPAHAQALRAALAEDGGHEVWVTASAFEAGLLVSRTAPHVLIVDLSLPGLAPETLAEAIGRRDEHPGLRLIGFDTSVSDARTEILRQCGFHAILSKPIDPEALRALCSEVAGA